MREITDSANYRIIASEQPLSLATLFERKRPLLYPLLIRICGDHGALVVALQMLAYIVVWGGLAWTLYRSPRDAGRPIGATLVAVACFYLALYPEFSGWNHLIMTESLAISALVATVTFLLRALLRGGGANLLAAIGCAILNGLLRDASAYLSLLLILPVIVLLLCRAARPSVAALSVAGLLASYGCMVWSADHVQPGPMANRWVFPMLDVIGVRILPDAPATDYFVRHGMPMNDTLRGMTGKLSFQGTHDWQFYSDPELADFRRWLTTHGKAVYEHFLIEHPGYALGRVWLDRADIFQPFDYRLGPYPDTRSDGDPPPGRRTLFETGFPPRVPLLLCYLLGGIGAPLLVALGLYRRERRWWEGGLLAASMFTLLLPLAILSEHADTMETPRHSVLIPLQAVLVALLVTFFGLARPRQPPKLGSFSSVKPGGSVNSSAASGP